jgi:nitrous oxide reductase accessory protein NosL
MKDITTDLDRRRVLALLGAGVASGLAGCGGDGSTPTATSTGGVPAAYETATSIGGVRRDPGALSARAAVNYQEEPNGDEQCSNCRYYIEDRNGDGAGACAVVEGTIAPDAWCVSYAAYQSAMATTSASTGTETATETPAVTETPAPSLGEPVTVPENARCPVCEMKSANFPDWNAQAVHEDGTQVFFDTAGCLVTYYALPDEFAETDAPFVGVWVTDFETRELVDGTTAHYALETDSDRVDDPMRLNPAPFADRADAVAYVDAVDYLTTDDIVGLDDFDRELVTRYRSNFLEEE